ncbi:hypothetical protein EON64_02105 [archaeon]|nr:MAG: hypothetical protein EON64_02105 [archaeon]
MQQQSAKKPPSSWTLRYQARPDFVNLGRFSDPIDPASLEKASMYFQTEELRPDEDLGADADEYASRRRRRQRSFYRRKQTIQLNCEKEGGNVHFEGKHITVDLNNEENETNKSSTDFQYVLLQFVKVEGSNAPEIHVIPVGDNFAFRKTGQPTDILLAEIEDKYNEEKEKTASLLNKYKKISQNITRYFR